ncbi:MAG: ABC transporter ATP-binding protein [Clostridia bacterium]
MKSVVLKIDDLSYKYSTGSTALEHINIEIYENEFVAIIGQNGAGKSTLLKNITGLLTPTVGNTYVNGRNTKDLTVSKIAMEIGFVLQNPDRQLFAETVEEEVAYGLKNAKLPADLIEQKVVESLTAVGLQDKRKEFPPALSKGDRAKVVIASVIAMGAKIIILDEPTSGQDYRGCYQIMNIAKELHKMGRTIVFVTHNMSLVAEYAKRIIVMSRKRVMMDSDAEDVFSQPEKLATTNITPPQITLLASKLQEFIPIKKTVLFIDELGDELLVLHRK